MVVVDSAKPKLTNEKNSNKFLPYILVNGIKVGTCVELIYIFLDAKSYQVKNFILYHNIFNVVNYFGHNEPTPTNAPSRMNDI